MKKAFTCLVEIFIIGIQKIELHYRIMEKKSILVWHKVQNVGKRKEKFSRVEIEFVMKNVKSTIEFQ